MQDYSLVLNKALGFLARREHAGFELKQKLQRSCDDLELIDEVIDECVRKDFLSDLRYANHFVEVKAKAGWGPNYIRFNLEKWQIANTIIEQSLGSITFSCWVQNGFEWIIKRHDKIDSWSSSQVQKLLKKGFSMEIITEIKKIWLESA